MQPVVILGPGASGKSVLARRICEVTGLPVIELDKLFWRPGLSATSREEWIAIQEQLARRERWIMDGDLGPYDAVEIRLRRSDTVIFLDFSSARCAWRAFQRSRERADFWIWLLRYHNKFRHLLMQAIARSASDTTLHILRNPMQVRHFITGLKLQYGQQ